MSLAVALPFGLAAAVAYGASAAVQHEAVGQVGDAPLRQLVRNRRWLASIGGDSVGQVLQLVALATGPVVVIQPLFVLCLPIALPIRAWLGAGAPTRRDYLAALVLVLGLGGFFLIAGRPGASHELGTVAVAVLAGVALAAGLGLTAAVRPLRRTVPSAHSPSREPARATVRVPVRPLTLSAVAGAWFGVEAVLVNSVAAAYDRAGWTGVFQSAGLLAAAGAVVVGLSGFALSQVAFGAGDLATSFPGMLVVDPLLAVTIGAVVLGESVRGGVWAGLGYGLCAAVVAAGTVALARPPAGPTSSRPSVPTV